MDGSLSPDKEQIPLPCHSDCPMSMIHRVLAHSSCVKNNHSPASVTGLGQKEARRVCYYPHDTLNCSADKCSKLFTQTLCIRSRSHISIILGFSYCDLPSGSQRFVSSGSYPCSKLVYQLLSPECPKIFPFSLPINHRQQGHLRYHLDFIHSEEHTIRTKARGKSYAL